MLFCSKVKLDVCSGGIECILIVICPNGVFNWAIQQSVPSGDETTAYFSFWYSTISLISLPTQLLVTAPVLRRWGVGPALLFLPLTLLVFAVAMGLWPILVFGTAGSPVAMGLGRINGS